MSYKHLIATLLICLSTAACNMLPPSDTNTGGSESTITQLSPDSIYQDSDEYIRTRFNELLNQMTLEEKIGQMTQIVREGIGQDVIADYYLGSVLSGGGGHPPINDIENWVAMTDGFQQEALTTRLAIPILYGVDAIHGHAELYGATVFPQPIGLGATRNEDLVRRVGQATAEEMLAVGVHWNFSPIIAVPQDIRWGRTYESYSEDTELVSKLGVAYLQGLQNLPEGYTPAEGQLLFTLATPKHFLGDGGTTFGTSEFSLSNQYLLDQGDMRFGEDEVRELFLPPYQAAVENGALSIMISYSSWNGVKMHASKYWITDVLKGELGFNGFVISDWSGIYQVDDSSDYNAVVTCINAGIDMNMQPYDYLGFTRVMKKAVMAGDIPMERIDDAVSRILSVKIKLGLFDHPFSNPSLIQTVGSQAHRDLARQAVRESLVLLKNDNKALPIPKDSPLIYVAGVAADDIGVQCGGWTTEWQGTSGDIQPGTTIMEGLKETLSLASRMEFNAIGNFSGVADVGIAVVGEFPYAEGMGDREELALSSFDQQLIRNLREHSQKLVVVIISGRPLIITEVYPVADAWVAAWLPGTEGNGVTDVLFGDYPFTGKLPYTWPRSNEQLPININTIESTSGCDSPLFPYGYGMGEAGSKPIKWIECASDEWDD
ncbi:MAG: glycoside hydrolase family 3 protein [Anaerolineaceae bacterium]|nr:glycoside hydrolase family 3 protein [Anaerolineaceae bacterium]